MSEAVTPVLKFRFAAESVAGTIYGVVTAMAVIAALASKSANVYFMAGAAFGAALVLALTYIYAHWLAGSYTENAAGHAGSRGAFRFELPTLIGPIVLGALMIIEHLAGVGPVVAAESTMWVGTVALFFLGYRIALQGGHGFRAALGFGLLDAAIGASLVLAKVLVH